MSILSRHRRQFAKPRLPDGIRIYALTDIHGCADLLEEAFNIIDLDLASIGSRRPIHVFMGDYIDRGPDSSRTIDLLVERGRRHESVFLKGNHEAFLFDVLRDASQLQNWKLHGGLQTLVSYGLHPPLNPGAEQQADLVQQLVRAIPPHQRVFYNNLKLSFVCGDFFFVHAGVRPGVALLDQREEDLLWIRDEFLKSNEMFGKYIVHGHTPVREADIRPNRLNIDTGAYATGNIALLTIQGDRIIIL